MAFSRPERAGDYLLLAPLHGGGSTEVWTAVRAGDTGARLLVFKRPKLGERASGAAAQAIERESDALRGAAGDHLPSLEDAGRLAGLPFVVTSFADGSSLASRPLAPLTGGGLTHLGLELTRAVGEVHARGRIHGDVAPSNVLVSPYGDVVLVDFGASVPLGDPRLSAGQPGYAAPEVLREGAAAASQDVYGVGVILAELALGRRLWFESKLVEAAARGPAPSAVAVIPELGPLLARALDRDEALRPTLHELLSALSGLPSDAAALGAWTERDPQQAPPRTERALVAVALVAEPAPAPPEPEEGALAGSAAREVVLYPRSAEAPSPAPRSARPRPGVTRTALLLGVALASALGGLVLGRATTSRARPTSAALAAQTPGRVSVEIDGRALTFDKRVDGLRPGSHTVTVRFGKQRHEIPVRIEAGEQLLLLPLARGTTLAPDE